MRKICNFSDQAMSTDCLGLFSPSSGHDYTLTQLLGDGDAAVTKRIVGTSEAHPTGKKPKYIKKINTNDDSAVWVFLNGSKTVEQGTTKENFNQTCARAGPNDEIIPLKVGEDDSKQYEYSQEYMNLHAGLSEYCFKKDDLGGGECSQEPYLRHWISGFMSAGTCLLDDTTPISPFYYNGGTINKCRINNNTDSIYINNCEIINNNNKPKFNNNGTSLLDKSNTADPKLYLFDINDFVIEKISFLLE